MSAQPKFEFPIQRAVRRMVDRNMLVRTFVTHEGRMIRHVNGYNLTADQILRLDSNGELTSEGIETFARKWAEQQEGASRGSY
jgi:hypothetical protein